uniref:Secreted protein n=1 Tax=Eutreptiella gymnastica TaxID=73025 RepID=A0A7S4LA16_9EUGL
MHLGSLMFLYHFSAFLQSFVNAPDLCARQLTRLEALHQCISKLYDTAQQGWCSSICDPFSTFACVRPVTWVCLEMDISVSSADSLVLEKLPFLVHLQSPSTLSSCRP